MAVKLRSVTPEVSASANVRESVNFDGGPAAWHAKGAGHARVICRDMPIAPPVLDSKEQ